MRENLLHASPLVSAGLLAIFGIPWLVEALLLFLPSSPQDILPVCVCLQISPFYEDILYWIRAHPNDLILAESPL